MEIKIHRAATTATVEKYLNIYLRYKPGESMTAERRAELLIKIITACLSKQIGKHVAGVVNVDLPDNPDDYILFRIFSLLVTKQTINGTDTALDVALNALAALIRRGEVSQEWVNRKAVEVQIN